MKNFILLAVVLLTLPGWAAQSKKYIPTCFIKPCEIKGDFDGDGKIDRAILIQEITGKKGIEVRFANGKTEVIGAGHTIGNGGNNFSWMDHWELNKSVIEQGADETNPPKPKGDNLLLEQKGSASGIVFWNGLHFEWYQQGD